MAENIETTETKETETAMENTQAQQPVSKEPETAMDEHTITVQRIMELYKAETLKHAEVTRGYYKTLFFELKKRTDESGRHPIPNFEKLAMEYFENVVKHHDEDKFVDPEMHKYLALRHFNHATNGEFQITPYEEERGEFYIMQHRRNNDHHVECGMFHLARCTKFGEKKEGFRYSYFALMEMAADWASVAEELGVDNIKWFNTQLKKGRYVLPDEVIKILIDFLQLLNPFLEENRKLGRFGLHQPDHVIK